MDGNFIPTWNNPSSPQVCESIQWNPISSFGCCCPKPTITQDEINRRDQRRGEKKRWQETKRWAHRATRAMWPQCDYELLPAATEGKDMGSFDSPPTTPDFISAVSERFWKRKKKKTDSVIKQQKTDIPLWSLPSLTRSIQKPSKDWTDRRHYLDYSIVTKKHSANINITQL